MRVGCRVPMRIEFGGGGTDIPSFSDKHGGIVLSATINKYIYATIEPKHTTDLKIIKTDTKKSLLFKDMQDLSYNGDSDLIKAVIRRMAINYGSDIYLRSEIPPDTGLGSGASVAVTMVGLFNSFKHKKLNEYQIAEEAYKIMRDELNVKGGKQSFYSSVFGGFNSIDFLKDGFVRVNPIKIKRRTKTELEKHLLLAYIGKREKGLESQHILKKQMKDSGEQKNKETLEKLRNYAIEMHHCLSNDDIQGFGEFINKAFETKKRMIPTITNDKIEAISSLAKEQGALATRIQGAGGGGHLLILCETNKEHIVEEKLKEKGVNCVPFSFTNQGMETWEQAD